MPTPAGLLKATLRGKLMARAAMPAKDDFIHIPEN